MTGPLLALALAVAHADVAAIAAPCQVTSPAFSQPANGAGGVPIDTIPAVFFSSGSCGSGSWTLTLSTADDPAVATVTGDSAAGYLEVDAGELLADTEYTLAIDSADGLGQSSVLTFTTGSGVTTVGENVPVVESLSVTWAEDQGVPTLEASVAYGPAGANLDARWSFGPEGTATPETVYRLATPGPAQTETVFGTSALTPPLPDYCLRVAVREFNGDWTESEEVCAAVEDQTPALCAAAGGPASAVGLLVAALAAARRRAAR
jgi:hypothetical protein